LYVHEIRPGSSEPLGPQQRRDHVNGDDQRPRPPEHGDHRDTRFNAVASKAKTANAPAPTARKVTSANPASSLKFEREQTMETHNGAM